MATFNSKIKKGFTLANIKECLEEHDTRGRAIMLDIVGTLASIGLATKEVSHNQWIVTYITDISTNVVNIDFQADRITYSTIDVDDGTAQVAHHVCSAENLWKLIIGLEYGYAKANHKCK